MYALYLISVAVLLQCSFAFNLGVDQCGYKLEPIGCFKDDTHSNKTRVLPHLLINERDRSSPAYNGINLDWQSYNIYLAEFICRCAEAATRNGYTLIGVQHYGECWSGKNLEYDHYGSSETCVDSTYKPANKNVQQCDAKTGVASTNYIYRINPTSCEVSFEPVGCYNDNQMVPRPLPELLHQERDYSSASWNNLLVDWKNWNTYMPEMLCRCARAAKDKKKQYFAIQFWGECWAGTGDTFKRDGEAATGCKGKNFTTCPCNSYECVGRAYENFVYRMT